MEKSQNPDQPPKLRVGITYNLKKHAASDLPDDQAEYDDFSTIEAIKSALEEGNCHVELLEATEDLPGKLALRNVDIVFNVAEGSGGRGREAQVPALLNFFRIPFAGSDETTLCIALDKALTKRLLATYHIKSPDYTVIKKGGKISPGRLNYPVIVKPNAEGSSKGISSLSLVSSRPELNQLLAKNIDLYRQDMLVEEYIEGREFTVGILGNGEDTRVFSPMEIVFEDRNNPIYSFEVKKDFKKYVRYECPANLTAEVSAKIQAAAKKIYEVLECRDFARIDFRLSPDGTLYFIEINPLPGLAPGYSDFPMIAEFNGTGYSALVRGILKSALKRYQLNFVINE